MEPRTEYAARLERRERLARLERKLGRSPSARRELMRLTTKWLHLLSPRWHPS
jgi:phage terminase small subunit